MTRENFQFAICEARNCQPQRIVEIGFRLVLGFEREAFQIRGGAHRDLVIRTQVAFELAYDLACQEWNVRPFIGGSAAPSPLIEAAILCGRDQLEVRCKRCGHGSMVGLTEVIWPRDNQVHTLAAALRCQRCKDERRKVQTDLVALHREGQVGSGGAGEARPVALAKNEPAGPPEDLAVAVSAMFAVLIVLLRSGWIF